MIKKAFILFWFVFSFLLLFSIKNVDALGETFTLSDFTTDFNVTVIGNSSITYNVSITLNTTLRTVNTTFSNTTLVLFVPYGMRNNSNFCNRTWGVATEQRFRTLNLTHEACYVDLGNITNTTTSGVNKTFTFTFTSTVSSFTDYNISERFWANINCTAIVNGSGVNTGPCTMYTLTLSDSFGQNWWVNPRPFANFTNNNMNGSLLKFIGWGQTRPYYEVWVPLMAWNESRKRPIAANATYADVIYADKPFFNNPTYFEMWSYNLTFTIYHNGTGNNLGNVNYTYDIYFPAVDTSFQTLRPLLVQNITFIDISNTTRSQIAGFPTAAPGFTVVFSNYTLNETHTDTTLFGNYSINISYNSAFGIARNYKLFTVTVPPNQGNITLSVQLAVLSNTSSTVSPIYIHNQVIGGFDPTDAPPEAGSNISMNYIIEVNNSLLNFTLDDLRLHFLAPKNVTITNNSLFANLSTNANVSFKQAAGAWNFTANTVGSAINFSEMCTNITDGIPGSPSKDQNLNICFYTWDINLSHDAFNRWYPGLQNQSNVTGNLTATMSFPILNKTNSTPNSAGSANYYNGTFSLSQAGALNLSAELPGIGANVNNTVVVYVDGQRLTNGSNFTVGSLIINSLSQGTHSIGITYSVASSTTTTTTTGGGGSSSGGPAETKKGHSEKQLFIKITPGAASIMKIVDKEIGFKEIIIMVKNQANTVLITVTKLDGQPARVTHTINGTVYKYIEVNKTNIEDSNLQDLKIRFEVLKSWFTDNKFDKEKLYLFRYSNGWQKLPTTIYSETNTTIDYEATTPGFSVFAIAAEQIPESGVIPPLEGEAQPPTEEQPPVTPAEKPNLVWLWILLGLAALGIIVFVIIKNRKK